ncbi:hypothetical protein E2C01_084231 [Portunus trituberculatus]|uniref:Uncharacterized protein n=1 Tax=Portunus trituberculatus TaxID=210409 RepID=A0A5B7IZE0_PORTR|nr:hypothetical protein [Portunus trituberculatus]
MIYVYSPSNVSGYPSIDLVAYSCWYPGRWEPSWRSLTCPSLTCTGPASSDR